LEQMGNLPAAATVAAATAAAELRPAGQPQSVSQPHPGLRLVWTSTSSGPLKLLSLMLLVFVSFGVA